MKGYFDFEQAHARRTDPKTSHEAAESQAPQGMTKTKTLILGVLRLQGPMTDPQIYEALRAIGHSVSPSGARTRRSSLVPEFIEDSGQTLTLESGRKAIIWRLKE